MVLLLSIKQIYVLISALHRILVQTWLIIQYVFSIAQLYNISGLIIQQEDARTIAQMVYTEITWLCLVLKYALTILMQINLIIFVSFHVSHYMLMTILSHVLKYAPILQQLAITLLDVNNFATLALICWTRFAIKLVQMDFLPIIWQEPVSATALSFLWHMQIHWIINASSIVQILNLPTYKIEHVLLHVLLAIINNLPLNCVSNNACRITMPIMILKAVCCLAMLLDILLLIQLFVLVLLFVLKIPIFLDIIINV
jgi:hypothetical protein